jgi:hypothetical protein
MTLVDHTRDRDLTVQGSQAARARALGHLLEDHDLPTVTRWLIYDCDSDLSGLILPEPGDAGAQRRAMQAWATYLGAPVTETCRRDRVRLSVKGWAYGVRVEVWAQLPAEEAA